MIRPNPLPQVYVAEKAAENTVVAAHRYPHPRSRGAQRIKSASPFFSSLLVLILHRSLGRSVSALPA
jgi:hypothetical protein